MGLALLALAAGMVRADDGAGSDNPYLDAMQPLIDGRYEEAGEALRRLVAREPEHAGAWLDLAILQCGLGNASEAELLDRLKNQVQHSAKVSPWTHTTTSFAQKNAPASCR